MSTYEQSVRIVTKTLRKRILPKLTDVYREPRMSTYEKSATHVEGWRHQNTDGAYRGTPLIRNCLLLGPPNTPPAGPYSRTMPRALRWS